MNERILFPNLGIDLAHVGRSFSIGPVTIAYYGICIAVGMLLGITALLMRAKETGQSRDDYLDISIWAMIFGVIGARIYYVIFSWEQYRGDLLSVFNLREGGLAIYGGIIGGFLTILVISRMRKIPVPVALDTIIIGLPVGQILGRWGNFFNREAFGKFTDGLFAMQLPVSEVRLYEITEEMLANSVLIDGAEYIAVHPTFLYEGMWNCLVLLMLFLMRNRTKFPGELFLLYLIGYGTGRFMIETLRTDQLLFPGTQIPVSMLVAGITVMISIILIILNRRKAV